jgi:arylsulfatase A-like enzyme
MKRRIIIALAASTMVSLTDAAEPGSARPNIVFVLVDDLGWKDLGCFGAKIYETPNLDRLCADGLRFTQAYTPISICSPARASMMTGKHPMKLGMWHATHHIKKKDAVILPSYLKQVGYQTWHVGKWHLGRADQGTLPEDLGFDVNIGGCQSWAPGSYWWPYDQRHKGHPHIGVQKDFVKRGKKGDYLTDTRTDEAIGLMEKRDTNRPFYLNFWHYAVHEEHDGKPDLVEKGLLPPERANMLRGWVHSGFNVHPRQELPACPLLRVVQQQDARPARQACRRRGSGRRPSRADHRRLRTPTPPDSVGQVARAHQEGVGG